MKLLVLFLFYFKFPFFGPKEGHTWGGERWCLYLASLWPIKVIPSTKENSRWMPNYIYYIVKDVVVVYREAFHPSVPSSIMDGIIQELKKTMGFVSFMGRVLFSAIFMLAAWQK
jgi:hypothetical protein